MQQLVRVVRLSRLCLHSYLLLVFSLSHEINLASNKITSPSLSLFLSNTFLTYGTRLLLGSVIINLLAFSTFVSLNVRIISGYSVAGHSYSSVPNISYPGTC
jgi:hypothetical protein